MSDTHDEIEEWIALWMIIALLNKQTDPNRLLRVLTVATKSAKEIDE